MSPEPSGWSGLVRWVLPILVAMACLVFLTLFLGEFAAQDAKFQFAWQVMLQLIGVFILLAGVVGVVRGGPQRPDGAPRPTHGHIALMLAGGMLAGGGWGAALGLGLLGAAACFARRDRDEKTPASE